MITDSDSPLTNDLRVQEYNMIKISSQIASEDYIDIRLRMPSGLDYIVISKKKIEIPQIEGVDSLNTIWMKLTEDETEKFKGLNAAVENYGNFFAQNVFPASAGVVLMQGALAEAGFEVTLQSIAFNSIPVMIIAIIVSVIQFNIYDRKLKKGVKA